VFKPNPSYPAQTCQHQNQASITNFKHHNPVTQPPNKIESNHSQAQHIRPQNPLIKPIQNPTQLKQQQKRGRFFIFNLGFKKGNFYFAVFNKTKKRSRKEGEIEKRKKIKKIK